MNAVENDRSKSAVPSVWGWTRRSRSDTPALLPLERQVLFWQLALVLIVTSIGLTLRLYRINASLWLDEEVEEGTGRRGCSPTQPGWRLAGNQ